MLNPSDSGAWERASPFAIVYFVGKTVRTFARSFVQLAATFGALALLTERKSFLVLAIPVGILVILAIGVVQYWFFRFRLEEDRILIRQGFLRKTALDLPYDRVQAINVERSVLDRLLGLVTVSLDTAGSAGAEGQLPSVSLECAEWLRARVAIGRGGRIGDDAAAGGEPSADPTVERVGGERPGPVGYLGEELLKLTSGDMIRIGLSNRNILVAAAFLGAITETLGFVEEALQPAFDAAEAAFAGADGLARTILVALLALSALVVVSSLVVGAAFLRYHNYTVWRQGTAFRSRAGLLTQKEVVVETAKIQQLTLSQNLVMRWFGRYRLRAMPAALLPGQGGDTPSFNFAEVLEIPLLRSPLAEELRARMLGREGRALTLLPHSPEFIRVSPHYIRALTLRIGIVPGLAGTLLLLRLLGPTASWGIATGIWWLAWMMLSGLLAWQRWRRQGYMYDDDGLASRSGLVGRKVDVFLFRKAQSVTVRRSPLQRRKGLATLEVVLACGAVRVPYIDYGFACRLRDYILYRAESSDRRWH